MSRREEASTVCDISERESFGGSNIEIDILPNTNGPQDRRDEYTRIRMDHISRGVTAAEDTGVFSKNDTITCYNNNYISPEGEGIRNNKNMIFDPSNIDGPSACTFPLGAG